MASKEATFNRQKHIKFWLRCSTLLPQDYQSSDASRLSLGFFIVAALDLLSALHTIALTERNAWTDWIYSLQLPSGGFRGFPGTNLGSQRNLWNCHHDPASLPSTYLALLTLLILGNDLGRVRRRECLSWVGKLQRANGSFGEFIGEDGVVVGGDDLRGCYCAVGTALMLQGRWDEDEKPTFNEKALLRFISNCQGHDGGFGQTPLLEGHSGLNFCAIAALACLDKLNGNATDKEPRLHSGTIDIQHNIHWMLQRQTSWVDEEDSSSSESGSDSGSHEDTVPQYPVGFNGRLGKMADTCYCFWNAGALSILSSQHPPSSRLHLLDLIDKDGLRNYLLTKTQHTIGGFGKAPGAVPDVMHSYLGLAALAVMGEEGLKEIDPVLAVSRDAAANLERVAWKKRKGP